MRSSFPCPLAPLLEPDTLDRDRSSEDLLDSDAGRQMIARVAVMEAYAERGPYVALLEESPEGDVLRVTELGAYRIVTEYVRIEGIDYGACTYEEAAGERTLRVAWNEGTAVESESYRRPSVA